MWAALQLILLLQLCTALVRGEEPDNLLEEEGYLPASNLFHLPEGSGGGVVEGSAEGSAEGSGEVESELEEIYPKLRNITIFPACISDHDCTEEGYKCFQYMCYPWKKVSRDKL